MNNKLTSISGSSINKLALTVAKKIVGNRVFQAAVIVFIITVKLKHVKIA